MLEGATLDSPDVLVVDNGYMKATWPFLGDRLRDGLVDRNLTVMWESIQAGGRLRDIPGIADVPALVLVGIEPDAADIEPSRVRDRLRFQTSAGRRGDS